MRYLILGGFLIEIKTKIRYLKNMITAYYDISYFGFNFLRKSTH